MSHYFDATVWMALPYQFWSLVFFTFGCIIGSFLNVCIHRMPRGESLISPPSHCPHCNYSIPWYLNVPLFTWLYLKGRCANCRAEISVRYFLVELLTGVMFLSAWFLTGREQAGLAVVYCILFSGLIVATFIDFEHFIIPDEITIGGIVVGFICSFLVPALHEAANPKLALERSFYGILFGGGALYVVLRLGKLMFGKRKLELPADTRVVFTETALVFPDQEILYEEIFYRKSDAILLQARTVELVDRCYRDANIRLMPDKLFINDEELNPEQTPYMEVVTDKMTLPREAMGFGDVKFMAAIGAFLGWQAALFSLLASSIIGAIIGVTLILMRKQEWSSRLPYGPYIALATVIWVWAGNRLVELWLSAVR